MWAKNISNSCSQRNDRDVRETIPELVQCSRHLFIVRQTKKISRKLALTFKTNCRKSEWSDALSSIITYISHFDLRVQITFKV